MIDSLTLLVLGDVMIPYATEHELPVPDKIAVPVAILTQTRHQPMTSITLLQRLMHKSISGQQ